MPYAYNLYRFGFDEFAVGQLINRDLPEDDEERWNILKAPEWHIRRMCDEHRRARQALASCSADNKPFVLYLRSFSAEHKGAREGLQVTGSISMASLNFQSALLLDLEAARVPVIRLHGGSDGFFSGADDVCVLSTHAENWEAVARELIENAGVIVFLLSDLSPGVKSEIGIIRALGLTERCVIAIDATGQQDDDDDLARDFGLPATVGTSPDAIRQWVADFPHVVELARVAGDKALPSAIAKPLHRLLQGARATPDLPLVQSARFTYLEPSFVTSGEYEQTEQRIWQLMRELRGLLDEAYWSGLEEYGVSSRGLEFENAWIAAHQVYGLAIAACDFRAIDESLQLLFRLYLRRNADFALLIPGLSERYRDLAASIFGGPPTDTEAAFATGVDLTALPRTLDTAVSLHRQAMQMHRTDPQLANMLHFAALSHALSAPPGTALEPRHIAAQMADDWAAFQFLIGLGAWGIIQNRLATAILRRLVQEDGAKYSADLARSLNNLGKRFWDLADQEGAEAAYREALAIRRRIGADTPSDAINLYNSLAGMGWLLGQTDRVDEARDCFDQAITHCRELAEEQPENRADLVRILGWKANALASTQDSARESAETLAQAEHELAQATAIDAEMRAALGALIAGVKDRLQAGE